MLFCYCAGMKTESGFFTPNSTNAAIILDDDTLVVDRVYFMVTHATSTNAGASTGFSDETNHQTRSVLNYGSGEVPFDSSTYSITHYKRVSSSNVLKIAGTVTDLSEAGMIYLTFAQYDASLTIHFIAEGH